jgi:hypothetical protein
MTRLLLTSALAFCTAGLCAQNTFSSPGEYGIALFNEHAAVANKNMEYLQYSVHSDDIGVVEQKRMALIEQIQQSLKTVRAMSPYEGDSKLRDEIGSVFEAYLASFRVEFSRVNTLKLSSRQSYEAMEQYLNATTAAEKKLDEAGTRAARAQEAFAKKYKIQLLEDEEKAGGASLLTQMNDYYRGIFLRVFKTSKKDAEFSDALAEQNAGKMDRYRKELDVICDDNLAFLSRLPDFNGDTEYRDAAVALMKFYKDLAYKGYKTMTDVVRKGDKMTNEDVTAFNEVISRSNEQLPALSDAVNEAADRLFKKNVPKPIPTRRT